MIKEIWEKDLPINDFAKALLAPEMSIYQVEGYPNLYIIESIVRHLEDMDEFGITGYLIDQTGKIIQQEEYDPPWLSDLDEPFYEKDEDERLEEYLEFARAFGLTLRTGDPTTDVLEI